MKMDTCIFCSKSLFDGQPVVVLRQKGCGGIEKASITRESELRTVVGQSVYVKCRQEYTNPLVIESYRKRTANDSEAVGKYVFVPLVCLIIRQTAYFVVVQTHMTGRSPT